jgi:hypothetical protein
MSEYVTADEVRKADRGKRKPTSGYVPHGDIRVWEKDVGVLAVRTDREDGGGVG